MRLHSRSSNHYAAGGGKARVRVSGRPDGRRALICAGQLAARVRTISDDNATKVTVMPNGVDAASFGNCPGRQRDFAGRLVWTGRISKEKGLENLLEAMPALLRKHPETALTVIGDEPVRETLEKRMAALGLADSVNLPGRVTHDEVARYPHQADIFVFPSLTEGLPLSVLETISVGLPVTASQIGGIPDVIRSEGGAQNGIVVSAGDSEALAKAIKHRLDNSEKARRMGQAGQALIRDRYSWTHTAEETMKLYARLC